MGIGPVSVCACVNVGGCGYARALSAFTRTIQSSYILSRIAGGTGHGLRATSPQTSSAVVTEQSRMERCCDPPPPPLPPPPLTYRHWLMHLPHVRRTAARDQSHAETRIPTATVNTNKFSFIQAHTHNPTWPQMGASSQTTHIPSIDTALLHASPRGLPAQTRRSA